MGRRDSEVVVKKQEKKRDLRGRDGDRSWREKVETRGTG